MQFFKISVLCLVLSCFSVMEGYAFRCGSGLVTTGDKKINVSVACGIPTSKEKICPNIQTTVNKDKQGRISKSKKCAKKAEVWYYNCGENDYIYALTFEDGRLVKESTEGRGSGKSDCLGK
ncbi:MAG TPA: DUF2845 domain-containing protein [Smithellaceae bacterium]|jgi:hypothetical protein|nr:DUF2845 domain-containing protein [Smithellaceae bacterium]HQM44331.1 DUF2845 domain-containing protein [Smithellaceae bacterium]